MAGNRYHPPPVREHDVLALTRYLEPGFLQGPNNVKMIHARDADHG
jgi:hypothetical protein